MNVCVRSQLGAEIWSYYSKYNTLMKSHIFSHAWGSGVQKLSISVSPENKPSCGGGKEIITSLCWLSERLLQMECFYTDF